MNSFELLGTYLLLGQVLTATLIAAAIPKVRAAGGGIALPLFAVILDAATAIWIWRVLTWQG